MSAARTKTKKQGLAAIRFSKVTRKTKRQKLLDKRQKAAEQASIENPTCQRLRSWLLKTDPEMMGFHERYTLIGCAFVELGFDPNEMMSQPEQVKVLDYQNVSRRIAAELGHCLTGCDDSHRVDGICKHTGQACSLQRYEQVLEYIGMINKPEVCGD